MAIITEHVASAPATPTPAGAANSPTPPPPSRMAAGLITAPSPPPIATLTEEEAATPVLRDDDIVLRQQMQALKERYEAVHRTFRDFPGFLDRPLTEADREDGESRLAFKNRLLLAAEARRAHIERQEVWLKANPDFGEAVAEMAAEDRQKGKGRPRPKQATRRQRSAEVPDIVQIRDVEEIPDIEEIPPPTPSVPSTASKRGRSPSEEEPHPKKPRKSSGVKANLSREMQRARKKAEDDRARAAEEKKRLAQIETASKAGKKQEIPCESCGDAGLDCYRKGENACSRCKVTHNPCTFPTIFSKLDQLNDNVITLNETLRFGFYMLGTEMKVFRRGNMFKSWAKDFLKPYKNWTAEGDKGYQREKQREAQEQGAMDAGPSGTSHEDIEVISDSEKAADDDHEMEVDGDDAQKPDEDDEEKQDEHEQDEDEQEE